MTKTEDAADDRTVKMLAVKGWHVLSLVGAGALVAIFQTGVLVNTIDGLKEKVSDLSAKHEASQAQVIDLALRLVRVETWRDGPRSGFGVQPVETPR